MSRAFPPEITVLKDRACKLFGVTAGEMVGAGRQGYVCRARFAVMRAASRKGYSTPQIGRALGGRDHTTVLNGLHRAAALTASDPVFAAQVDALEGSDPDAWARVG